MLADVTLSLGDYGVFVAILTVPAAMFAYFVKTNSDEQASLREDMKALHQRTDGLNEKKVSREDWLRDSMGNERKLDQVLENQARLSATVDSQAGLAESIKRIASALQAIARKEAHERE